MRRLFGTDGIRGKANVYPVTPELVFRLGKAAVFFFKRNGKKTSLVIGRDTRLSSPMLEEALVSGISSAGGDVLKLGILPTPAIACLTKSLGADAGIVISASHNPYEDNGIKFFSRKGFKLSNDHEERMENILFKKKAGRLRAQGKDVGRVKFLKAASRRYIDFLKESLPEGMSLNGFKTVIDCAHGACYKIAPQVLRELGAEVIVLHNRPNGININRKCGSLYPEAVQKRVIREGADFGVAFDGDGDRAIPIDERGEVVDGDQVMTLCAQELIINKKLSKKTIVATVMSNLGLEIAMRKMGGRVIRSSVGDRYVLDEMLKENLKLGGEQSGHIIFLEHNSTGDGIITVLQILSIMKRRNKSLSDLARIMEKFPQVLVNVRIKKKGDISSIKGLNREIERAKKRLGGKGRILVRPSGTEPLIRVMVEGRDRKEIEVIAQDICKVIKEELG